MTPKSRSSIAIDPTVKLKRKKEILQRPIAKHELQNRKLKIALSVENDVVSKQTVHAPSSFHISTDSAETAAKPFGSRLLPVAHLTPTMPSPNAKMS